MSVAEAYVGTVEADARQLFAAGRVNSIVVDLAKKLDAANATFESARLACLETPHRADLEEAWRAAAVAKSEAILVFDCAVSAASHDDRMRQVTTGATTPYLCGCGCGADLLAAHVEMKKRTAEHEAQLTERLKGHPS